MLNSCSCSCPSLLQLLLWVRAVVQCPILQKTNRGQRSCSECCRLLFFIIFLPFKLVFIFQAGAVWVILRLGAVYIHAHVGQCGIQGSLFFAFMASLPLHAPVLEPDFNLMESKANNESVEHLHLCGIERRNVRGGGEEDKQGPALNGHNTRYIIVYLSSTFCFVWIVKKNPSIWKDRVVKQGPYETIRPTASLTCVSVSMSEVATSKRFGLDKYLLSLNWFSNSSSCWLVKAVLGLRHFPSNPPWDMATWGKCVDKTTVEKWYSPQFR